MKFATESIFYCSILPFEIQTATADEFHNGYTNTHLNLNEDD